jgi:hypothetical protein
MKIKEIVQRIFKKEAKVHILLDIDGVLSPDKEPIGEYEIISQPWGRWAVRTDVLEWVKELSSMNAVQVHWVSTWGEESNFINKYLKIKDFPYFRVNGMVKEGKLKAIKEQLATVQGKTIIVIDDDLNRSQFISLTEEQNVNKLRLEITNLAYENQNAFHGIVPDSNIGISDEEMKFVGEIIKQELSKR